MNLARACLVALAFVLFSPVSEGAGRPNIVLVISDDQGTGDLGLHGNDKIKTPHLDRFGREGIRFTRFYVSPVCAPTRAALMTGRFYYRTGVIHTSRGGAKMSGDETTMAELLGGEGYRTGIFGKWHLGDNYPMRPQDQGFQEVLVHKSGGITQPPDQPSSYFDPVLWQNGRRIQAKGYCTDVFFRAALQFMEKEKGKPFFAYIPLNAPHTPLEVSEDYAKPYRDMGLDDTTAKVYGMVQNLDENFGKLTEHLEKLGLRENTLVIFMTDNGPQQERYTMNLRGRKSMTYEGGIRVPFLVQWPAQWKGGRQISTIAADMDVLPTVLSACDFKAPAGLKLDGVDLKPLLENAKTDRWPDRQLFFQVHRGLTPHAFQNMAVVSQRWKLVGSPGTFGREENPVGSAGPVLELYDIEADPAEKKNLAAEQPEQLKRMRTAYEKWFEDVLGTRRFKPGDIVIGHPAENPVHLCYYQDATWAGNSTKGWQVAIENAGDYRVSTVREDLPPNTIMVVAWQGKASKLPIEGGKKGAVFKLGQGQGQIEAWLENEKGERLPIDRGGIQGDVVIEKL